MPEKFFPLTVWMTGLSGSGKTTLSKEICSNFTQFKQKLLILDGDILRQGLCSDLNYTLKDRTENIRRTAHVASLMNGAGISVIVALISPLRSDRQMARNILGDRRFVETYIATNLYICEKRDPKGLYSKARSGTIQNFTGISSPYEYPEKPEIVVDTCGLSKTEAYALFMHQFKKLLQ